jgi:hypothetical protein
MVDGFVQGIVSMVVVMAMVDVFPFSRLYACLTLEVGLSDMKYFTTKYNYRTCKTNK